VRTAAATGDGVSELWEAIAAHRAHLEESGTLDDARRTRLLREVEGLASERLRGGIRRLLADDDALSGELASRRTDPYEAAAILTERILSSPGSSPGP